MNNVDKQYLDLYNDIWANGTTKESRSGDVKSVFGRQLRFNLEEGLPILTTKKVYTKGIIHELLWFLKGDTNIKYLVENKVYIWNADAYRFYCEKVKKHNDILQEYKTNKMFAEYSTIETDSEGDFIKNVLEQKRIFLIDKPYEFEAAKYNYTYGDLGPVYGKQWRAFDNQVDQINKLIETLKNNPEDRRMLCIAFNPTVADEVALPPCHVMFQLYTKELTEYERLKNALKYEYVNNDVYEELAKEHVSLICARHNSKEDYENFNKKMDDFNIPRYKLSLMWYQRSVDFGLGLPFNITSYAILTHIFAKLANMIPHELIGSLGDCHIYFNQRYGLMSQLEREGYDTLPTLVIEGNQTKIEDFKYDDFKIVNYLCEKPVKMPLSVG